MRAAPRGAPLGAGQRPPAGARPGEPPLRAHPRLGVARRLFVALGHHLAAAGVLAEARDVFYLTKEEIFGHLDGTAVTADLGRWRGSAAPSSRPTPVSPRHRTGSKPLGRGGAGCPACVREQALITDSVLRDGLLPRSCARPCGSSATRRKRATWPGTSLSRNALTPGWTLLFPAVEGLLVQRGSLLEPLRDRRARDRPPVRGGARRALEWLRDGEWVEMDGTSGTVRRLEE